MGGQGVAGQNGVGVACQDQPGKGGAGVVVKGEGGAHDPHDFAVVTLVAQQLVELIVVPGKSGLPGAALAEGEHIPVPSLFVEAGGMKQNAVLPLLCPAHGHQVALPQVSELPHHDAAAFQDRHAVHAALLGQQPPALHLEIFREDAQSCAGGVLPDALG